MTAPAPFLKVFGHGSLDLDAPTLISNSEIPVNNTCTVGAGYPESEAPRPGIGFESGIRLGICSQSSASKPVVRFDLLKRP